MPCNCKETRKVKTCPTISVEETILTELRNFYEYVVAKFTALFALPVLNQPTLVYSQTYITLVGSGPTVNFTIPEKCIYFSVYPVLDAPAISGDFVDLAPPGETDLLIAGVGQTTVFPVSPKYHIAGTWTARSETENCNLFINTISET